MARQPKTVLIVEDELPLRRTIAFEFLSEGWKVIETDNIWHAQKTIASEQLGLVVADQRLQNGLGSELLKLMRAKDLSLPFFLISAYTDIEVESVHDLGAEGMFTKPFDLVAFVRSADRMLIGMKSRLQEGGLQAEPAMPTTVRRRWSDLVHADRASELRLGRGGFFLASSEDQPLLAFQPGSEISFEFLFQFGLMSRLAGTGVVRWTRVADDGPYGKPPGIGVEFNKIDGKSLNTLIAVLDVLKSAAYIPRG